LQDHTDFHGHINNVFVFFFSGLWRRVAVLTKKTTEILR